MAYPLHLTSTLNNQCWDRNTSRPLVSLPAGLDKRTEQIAVLLGANHARFVKLV